MLARRNDRERKAGETPALRSREAQAEAWPKKRNAPVAPGRSSLQRLVYQNRLYAVNRKMRARNGPSPALKMLDLRRGGSRRGRKNILFTSETRYVKNALSGLQEEEPARRPS